MKNFIWQYLLYGSVEGRFEPFLSRINRDFVANRVSTAKLMKNCVQITPPNWPFS